MSDFKKKLLHDVINPSTDSSRDATLTGEVTKSKNSNKCKVSFIDNDYIPTYNKDDDKLNASGKRIKRGLYQTKNSHYINADINGSFNIMRKYLNGASDHILNGRCRGFVVSPYLVTFK